MTVSSSGQLCGQVGWEAPGWRREGLRSPASGQPVCTGRAPPPPGPGSKYSCQAALPHTTAPGPRPLPRAIPVSDRSRTQGCLAPHEATPSPGQEVLAQHRPGLGPWELPRAFLTALLPLLGQLTGPSGAHGGGRGGGVLSLPSLRHPSCCLPASGRPGPHPLQPPRAKGRASTSKDRATTRDTSLLPSGPWLTRAATCLPSHKSPLRASGLRHPFMKISSPRGVGPGDRLHPVWAKTSRVREGFPQARASRWGGSTAQGGSVHTQPGWRGGKAANEGLQGHVDPPSPRMCRGHSQRQDHRGAKHTA